MDRLLQEAHAILNSSKDLNSDREKLTNILETIVAWKADGSSDDIYFNHFQEMMVSMSSLNFSKRLPINSNQKSLQNLISYSLNMVNQELAEKAFPKALLFPIFKELELKQNLIIVTNYEGIIQFLFSSIDQFPTSGFEGKKVEEFFTDLDQINYLQLYEPIESITNQLQFGNYTSPVKVKIRSTPFKLAEGFAYIVKANE